MIVRVVAAAALVAAAVLPDRVVRGGPILCLFRRVTGRPCPSCGLTRSWQAIGHGRLGEGLAFHPLGPLTMLVAAWIAADNGAERRVRDANQRWGGYAGALWIAAWLWRLSRAG